jgi:hypothetical protein
MGQYDTKTRDTVRSLTSVLLLMRAGQRLLFDTLLALTSHEMNAIISFERT